MTARVALSYSGHVRSYDLASRFQESRVVRLPATLVHIYIGVPPDEDGKVEPLHDHGDIEFKPTNEKTTVDGSTLDLWVGRYIDTQE